ncbi:hypothetical protein [Microbacterium sp. MTN4-26]|uniref:hypothetical protein n=1 Tax=unclassified Microbacterium TaxID=2609290 RepID=UPI0036F44BA3
MTVNAPNMPTEILVYEGEIHAYYEPTEARTGYWLILLPGLPAQKITAEGTVQ